MLCSILNGQHGYGHVYGVERQRNDWFSGDIGDGHEWDSFGGLLAAGRNSGGQLHDSSSLQRRIGVCGFNRCDAYADDQRREFRRDDDSGGERHDNL
jgi:hypothetical protein